MSGIPNRILRTLIPDARFVDPEERRRARVLAVICCVGLVVGSLRGLQFIILQHFVAASFVLLIAAMSGSVFAGLRKGRLSLWWACAIELSVVCAIVVVISVHRGGIGTPVLSVLGMIPLAATYVLGTRSGLFWLVLSLSTIIVLSLLEGAGLVVFNDQVKPSERHMINTVVAMVIPVVLFGLAVVYEWSRLSSLRSLEMAQRERMAAEKDVILLRNDKMATVGLLASGVGHEINNPLTYVLGNVDFALSLLDSESSAHAQVVEALEDARDGAARIGQITGDLKSFSRIERSAELCAVHFNDVVETALRLTRRELVHRASLKVLLGDSEPVLAVENRMVQVVVNLLVNAAHAVEELDAGEIRVSCGTEGDSSWLEISDNGRGIPPDVQRRVFDPFFTTKSVGDGSGLGLSVSQQIVHAVGGTLTLESESGVGTTFRVSVPKAPRTAPTVPEEPVAPASSRYRFLVVDDEPLLGRALTRMLRPHHVLWCESGAAALTLLATDTAFDLVLCDVMMHPMGGWDVLERVEEHHPELLSKFVFLTGGAFTQTAQSKLDSAQVTVLRKPVAARDIIGMLAGHESS